MLETEYIRDSDGCVYRIESSDDEGVYISAPEGDTYRISMSQLLGEFVEA